jgi:hypothetical protein
MRPAKAKFKKFKLNPKYVHMRSEGLTRRTNGGTRVLIIDQDDLDDLDEEHKAKRRRARR